MKVYAEPVVKISNQSSKNAALVKNIVKNRHIYIMLIPVVLYFLLFHYVPMAGNIIAFKHYSAAKGIWGSEWVGFDNFIRFFNNFAFIRVLKNTLIISMYEIVFGFPAPIILALLFNAIRQERFKKIAQTISYLPHFISVVVICGMIIQFTSEKGVINDVVAFFGGERSTMLLNPDLFRPILVGSDIWQEVGWVSIIYLAALTSINNELYEAATIDGAGEWKQTIHITLPGILPTIIVMLILRMGQVMNVGHEKILLLYNASIYEKADVISTYVYRVGLQDANYDFSAAIGLFNSVINFALLMLTNHISKRATETSLW